MMRYSFFKACLFAIAVLAGTVASANVIVGRFIGTNGMETVENVAGMSAPEWSQGAGTYVEVTGTFVQTETAEASVWIRLLDESLPLTLVVWRGGVSVGCPGDAAPKHSRDAGRKRSTDRYVPVRVLGR